MVEVAQTDGAVVLVSVAQLPLLGQEVTALHVLELQLCLYFKIGNLCWLYFLNLNDVNLGWIVLVQQVLGSGVLFDSLENCLHLRAERR